MGSAARISTGVERLDHILGGGLPAARFHLVQGNPGSGKTTLGLQFLIEGLRRGESVLYVTVSETREELQPVTEAHGWDVSILPVFELALGMQYLSIADQNTHLETSELVLASAPQ